MSGDDNLIEVNITRVLNAPRSVVFKAWTNAEMLAKWWGPKDFTSRVSHIELKDGGKMHIDMKGPDGVIYPMEGALHDIIEPSLLVFTTTGFKDANGKPQLETLNTITFNEENYNTLLNLRAVVIRAEEEATETVKGMEAGWNQSLDKLAAIFSHS